METKRPTSPAAEEILGGYFPVLDHGFVALVDYMGSDEDVERAARVSYGYGTRKTSQTRGLVRYLRRHHHTTPSEMVELKFHCAMPMFVARQWVRHRTACLAEGTEVYFDLPGGPTRRGDQLYRLRIEEIWACRDRVRRMRLRQANEDTLALQHTRVVDVFKNGRKPVFRMVLEDGKSIEATADHRFLFADGWSTPARAVGLRERGGRAVWDAGEHFVYADPVEVEAHAPAGVGVARGGSTFAGWPPAPHVARSRLGSAALVGIERFEYVGAKETYDLEVEGPYHNFVANGIVTHNSVNEYSARYSLMPLLFYLPKERNFALQSRTNRQGREEAGAPPEVYREAVRRWEVIRKDAGEGYAWLLEEDVAREIARIDLPLSTYTQWYWKIDLHNLMHFLTLRCDERAQWEIQEYARVMAGMVKRVAPLTYEAWIDYGLEARPLSRAERLALSRLLDASDDGIRSREGATLSPEDLAGIGLSKREVQELVEKVGQPGHPDFELDLSRMRGAEEVGKAMEQAVPGTFE